MVWTQSHRGTFVAHVDDVHAALREPVPHWLDGPTLQAEDPIDAARDEEAGDEIGNGVASDSGHGEYLRRSLRPSGGVPAQA